MEETLWKDDIEMIAINLNNMAEHRFDFEIDYETFECALKLTKYIFIFKRFFAPRN